MKSNQIPVARINIVGILKRAKPPTTNVTSAESKAIRDLQRDDTIMILPADKGKATVVMDKIEYERKIETMLSDTNTYVRIPHDPAPALERRMNAFLLSLKKARVLPDALYYRLRSSAGKTPQFYGLPKIHKEGVPLRPIAAFINSPIHISYPNIW